MRINVVLWQDNHILPRMTQWLVDRNGWTVSEQPDPLADINYYMPYLKWELSSHPNTPTAAWFTHYEEGTPWKTERWHDAACFIDAPLVTSPIYYAMLGKAQMITPGVDLDIFKPETINKDARRVPIVGVVGQGQPRKGPHAIVDLYYGPMQLDIKIVGPGWPFPATHLSHDAMPAFYNLCDIFLCTSLIEGIPAPVLEALASDCKVVIPNDVGICDQLPEMEGIRHYSRGDSWDMIRAIQLALDDKPPTGLLREVVAGQYTVDQWCRSHELAMEAILDAVV